MRTDRQTDGQTDELMRCGLFHLESGREYDRFHLECHRWRNCGNENMRKPSRSPQKAANLGGSERSRELFLEVPVKITTLTLYQTWYDITDQRSKTPQGRHLEASQNHPRFAAFRGDLEGFLIFQISTLPPPVTP